MRSEFPHSHSQEHRIWRILEPTASSISVGVVGTLLLILYIGRAVFNGDEYWILAFLGRGLPLDQSFAVQDRLTAVLTFFQSTTVNGVLLFVFWLFLGIIAYELIQAVLYFFFEIQEDKHLIMYEKPGLEHHVPSLIRISLLRVAVRTVGMMVLLVYFNIIASIAWPTIISVFIGRMTNIRSLFDIVLGALAFMSSMVLFHGLTILLRALTLKLRLF